MICGVIDCEPNLADGTHVVRIRNVGHALHVSVHAFTSRSKESTWPGPLKGLVAPGLAPLDVTGQSIQVRENGALVNLVPEQRLFQSLPMCIRYSYPNNFSIRLELDRRSRVS